jgi:glutamate N-acetyltransferase/amino-acid N-acetyltransferase
MKTVRSAPEKILLPQGFSFSAVAAGIKASGGPDLALVLAAKGTGAAALFTSNRVVAAPVEIGRKALLASGSRVRAVVVNSGNANCATGLQGLRACEQVCDATGRLLRVSSSEIFPSSTGIIGVRLPSRTILEKLPQLISTSAATEAGALAFAKAIMTTDTRPKIASQRFSVGSKQVTLLGIAKGAGMIHPQLATMLVYLFSDVAAHPRELLSLLRAACDDSFNCMSIDGDTSTNDTVLVLATGASRAKIKDVAVRRPLTNALGAVCQSLAEQIISDGEGVQHVIRLSVEQARSREEVLQIARAISHSMLVKTAWAGADPNWGRILAAVGRSGIKVDPSRIQIFIGNQKVCKKGIAAPFNEKRAHLDLAKSVADIRVQLGRGRHSITFLTTDLTAEYVRINADYST